MKMPNAERPVANFHSTGAFLAEERVLWMARRVMERFLRTPITAGS